MTKERFKKSLWELFEYGNATACEEDKIAGDAVRNALKLLELLLTEFYPAD